MSFVSFVLFVIKNSLFFFLLFNTALLAQDPVHDFLDKIQYNLWYSGVIASYYSARNWDSIDSALDHWSFRCNEIEPIVRGKILLSVQKHTFSERDLPEHIIGHLKEFSRRSAFSDYRQIFDSTGKKDKDRWILDRYVEKEYNDMTKEWADQLSHDTSLTEFERAFCGFYAHRYDDLARPLSMGMFKGTRLDEQWNRPQKKSYGTGGAEFSLMHGFGEKHLVMPRIAIGGYAGYTHSQLSVGGSMHLLLALPLHEISARNGLGNIVTSNGFWGFRANIETGLKIMSYRKEQIHLNGGIGYEFLNDDFGYLFLLIIQGMLTPDDDDDDDWDDDDDAIEISPESISLNNFYPFVGIEWRRYHSFMKDRYTSYHLRFSAGHIDTRGGTKFKRGMISFHVRWGSH